MKSRIWLLCGALAVATSLSGCIGTMVQKTVEWGNNLTRSATGADDPNNNSAMARAGRMSVDNTNTALGAVGMKPADAAPPVALAPETAPASAVTETAPVAVAPAPAASATTAKKAPAKKVATKPTSSVKPVADTTKKPK